MNDYERRLEVSCIYFDNGLDICPGIDERFTWSPGDDFVLHWGKPTHLIAAYNTKFIREITMAHLPQKNVEEQQADPEPVNVPDPIVELPVECVPEVQPVRLTQICICEDEPDPTCPVHRK